MERDLGSAEDDQGRTAEGSQETSAGGKHAAVERPPTISATAPMCDMDSCSAAGVAWHIVIPMNHMSLSPSCTCCHSFWKYIYETNFGHIMQRW